MMRLNNQLLNFWARNLEVVVTVIWLIYFLGLRLPSPVPKLFNALSYPIMAILIILNWKRLSNLAWVATRDVPLLLIIGVALASWFWSADQGATLRGCRGLLRTFIFGAYFTTRYSLKEQMKILAWVFGTAAILTVVAVLAIPSYGFAGRIDHPLALQAIFSHKNSLGYAMALGASLFLITAIKERKHNWLAWGGFGLTSILTIMSFSSAARVSLLLLLSLMPVYKLIRQHYKLKIILMSMGCIMACTVALLIFVNFDKIIVDILGESLTFGARTPIWDLIIEKTLERPWLGYGLNAFWKSDAGKDAMIYSWSKVEEAIAGGDFNAHSGYFSFLPQLGFLGISLYAISFVTVSIRVFNLLLSTKKIEFFWFLQFLVFLTVTNFTDQMVSILGSTSYTSIYVLICLSTAIECRRIRVNQKGYLRTNLSKRDRDYCSQSELLQ